MVELIYFILGCYGLTNIICYGKILDTFRPKTGFFGELFGCSLCVGFWVGLLISFIFFRAENLLLMSFISSGTSYILDKIVDDDGIKIKRS